MSTPSKVQSSAHLFIDYIYYILWKEWFAKVITKLVLAIVSGAVAISL